MLNAVDCFNNYILAQWRRCSSGSYAIYPTNSKLPCYTVSAAGPWKTPAPIIELDVIPAPSLADKLALRGAWVRLEHHNFTAFPEVCVAPRSDLHLAAKLRIAPSCIRFLDKVFLSTGSCGCAWRWDFIRASSRTLGNHFPPQRKLPCIFGKTTIKPDSQQLSIATWTVRCQEQLLWGILDMDRRDFPSLRLHPRYRELYVFPAQGSDRKI